MKTLLLIKKWWLKGLLLLFISCGCPGDCPISWRVSALKPVFYGYSDYANSSTDRKTPPGSCRVFYPTLDGSTLDAPILEGCCRHQVIILVHGQCQGNLSNHYKEWFMLPAQLARSGYIVLIPSLPDIGSDVDAMADKVQSYYDWLSTDWVHKELVHPYIGVIGHSFGGPVGAKFSRENSNVKAFASLSGQYEGMDDYKRMNKPILFMRGDPSADIGEALVGYDWNNTPQPKHRADFDEGYHWDYISSGGENCNNGAGDGPCAQRVMLRTEIISMFFTRYLSRGAINNNVPLSLIPPSLSLTTDQQFYAGGNYMQTFDGLSSQCQVTLEWATSDGNGSEVRP